MYYNHSIWHTYIFESSGKLTFRTCPPQHQQLRVSHRDLLSTASWAPGDDGGDGGRRGRASETDSGRRRHLLLRASSGLLAQQHQRQREEWDTSTLCKISLKRTRLETSSKIFKTPRGQTKHLWTNSAQKHQSAISVLNHQFTFENPSRGSIIEKSTC